MCLFDDIEKPEKFRFSLGRLLLGEGDEPWNKAVMIRECSRSSDESYFLTVESFRRSEMYEERRERERSER